MNNNFAFSTYIKKFTELTKNNKIIWTRVNSTTFKSELISKTGRYNTHLKEENTFIITIQKIESTERVNRLDFSYVLSIINKKSQDVVFDMESRLNNSDAYLLDELYSLIEYLYEQKAIEILEQLI
ncbi:hypothetical protein [Treponema denticola]|uniref:hypothetical protein n=1 Tax=Treponema denticola TaxID=158 RepID=UPI0020A369B6|nr:hypothetical protein [Treponema denticola]UTC82769.1 hypothetical protein HGJ18_05945 [Treponema denticola]